jgi:hypothetical protein
VDDAASIIASGRADLVALVPGFPEAT